jgi:AmmeMemoRadiSam system protein B/AmmeMemoRadiSam system protein A
VQNQNPDTVLVIGLCHRGLDEACLFAGSSFQTPLGSIPVDSDLIQSLLEGGRPLVADTNPFRTEHSVEVNLPFIQTVFPHAQVVSILISRPDPHLCRQVGQRIASALQDHAEKRILLVVSSDMSHYPGYDVANEVDQAMLESLATLDPQQILADFSRLTHRNDPDLHCVMCGSAAMLTAVEAARALGPARGTVLHYANSGDSSYGDHSRVVGYGAFAISLETDISTMTAPQQPKRNEPDDPNNPNLRLSTSDRKELLALARQSIEKCVWNEPFTPHSDNPVLQAQCGMFVTIHNHGDLRGCLGRFDAGGLSLYDLAAVLAAESARNDMRFSPVHPEELPELDIQISVLTPLRQIRDINEIQIGSHGLQIRGRTMMGSLRSGTLLPQVATERNWDVPTFLKFTCQKAGLDSEAWKNPNTEIFIYGAIVFGELDPDLRENNL